MSDLRSQAVKAVNLRSAGSNALLLLSLAPRMQSDPGFYQVLRTILTFCRICLKTGHLLDFWRLWWQDRDGRISSGPFGRLLAVLGWVNWVLLCPLVIRDHGGFERGLLFVGGGALLLAATTSRCLASVRCQHGLYSTFNEFACWP